MQRIVTGRVVAGLAVAGALAAAATTAPSPLPHQIGINGYSGNPSSGGATCIACHSGGVPPKTKIEGPALVASGNTVTYTLRISGGQSVAGGLDVSTTGGALIATDPGTQLLAREITHTAPRFVDANGDVVFTFDLAAPATPTTLTLYGAGNSVDRDYTNSGDLSDKTHFDITVKDCTVTFQQYGVGLAGSGGFVPRLKGTDGTGDGNFSMKITKGLGGAAGFLIVGFVKGHSPFFGGTLWVDLATGYLLVPVVLNGAGGGAGAGDLDLAGADVRDAIGINVFLQAALFDPGAVRGVALSNGLEMDIQ